MEPPELIHTNFRDFLHIELPSIDAGGRANRQTLIAIDHLMCDLTTVVFVSPKNWIYRCKPDWWSPVQEAFDWLTQASALLDGGGLMKKEFSALGIRKSEVPTPLLAFHGSEDYSNPKKYFGPRCSSILIPTHQVVPVYQFFQRWFAELSQYLYWECSEEELLLSGGSANRRPVGTDFDLIEYPFLKMFGRWHGKAGLLARLSEKIAQLENGEQRQLAIPPSYLYYVSFNPSGREIFFDKRSKEFFATNAFENGVVDHPIDLATLDNIFCMQCRLIRLLDWPDFFVKVKAVLTQEQAFASTHPMTASIPYEPFEELSEYLASQREKYPILEESLYTPDAFLHPPIAKEIT